MIKYVEMKTLHQAEVDSFPFGFAFNQEQFDQMMRNWGFAPDDIDKIYSIGGGGYVRKTDVQAMQQMFARHKSALRDAMQDYDFAVEAFISELTKNEYYITKDLSDTFKTLGFYEEELYLFPIIKEALDTAITIIFDSNNKNSHNDAFANNFHNSNETTTEKHLISPQISNQYRRLFECIKEEEIGDETDFIYRIDDRGVIIERYLGEKIDLVIPENLEEFPVYKIDDEAFYQDEQIKKVTLPNTIRVIGNRAFAESNLEVAVLPNSLLIIGEEAFVCSSLKSVNIPESVSVIGEYAFSETDINSIRIPRQIHAIGQGAFSNTDIASVTIPKSVKTISKELFDSCKELQTVIIEGAQIIEESAFENCKKLKNLSLPDTLTVIEDKALNGSGIEFLIIPESVISIGEYNFPENSCIAILSDLTEINLDQYRDGYSTVTLYCNQSNIAVRKVAKEYGFKRKTLSAFAKESSDYYKNCGELDEKESEDFVMPHNVYLEPKYCKTKCEFYKECQANREICVKNAYGQVLQSLTPREEWVIRLIYGIEEYKESVQLVALVFGITENRVKQIWAKALRKMRHPTRSRALRSTDVGLVLLSTNETNYFNLWCAIFGIRSDHRQVELEKYIEKKQSEDAQRRKDEEEFANASEEQLSEIRKKIMAHSIMIEDLDLSVRAFNPLKRAGIDTVEDLTNMTWEEFIRIRNLGKKSGDEVLLKLEQLGFAFKSSDE